MLGLLCAAFLLLPSSFFVSCARMGSPDGGWYDDTPPKVVGSSPEAMGVNVKSQKVTIYFNEFVKLENAQEKVIVSPPQLETPEIRATGKRITVRLKDSLIANTTYTIDFSDAISDNNENNPMGNYTFTFSTGERIDTFEVSGYALDASNLEPIKGIMVGLYDAETFVDTTFHKLPMMRIARTNGSGRFSIKGVAPGRYYVCALQDADGDFVYGQKSEMIGYSRVAVEPSAKPDVRQDTVWRDSLHIDRVIRTHYTHFLPDELTLLCFQAPQTDRYCIKTERKDPEKIGFFFTYGHDSLPQLRGLNFEADSAFVVEASQKRDTVYYWLRDTTLVNQDTLLIEATFMMTDTLGNLIEKTDTVEALAKVPYAKRFKEKQKDIEKWQKVQERRKKRGLAYDSIMPIKPLEVKLTPTGQMSPDQNVWFEMSTPLASYDASAVHLYSQIDSVWYESPHLFEQTGPRTFVLKGEWRPGVEYSLEVDSAAFRGIYGRVSNAIKAGLKIRTDDEFSTVIVNLSGYPDTAHVVVQLMDGGDKVVRQTVADGGTAEFFYVKPASYYLRAFIDQNGNSLWDTGKYEEDLQADGMYYYPEPLECKAKWDVTRNWRLDAYKRFQQKPQAITKQKPDKEKQLRNRNVVRAMEKGILYVPK
jgi:uncharacterized protein (DUF2141 family)